MVCQAITNKENEQWEHEAPRVPCYYQAHPRQEGQASREAFPAHLERREVVLDLPEEQKVGLKPIGTKILERMRFEKPTVYIERILRHLYVKDDVVDPASSPVITAPTLPSIVEGCKYDFSIIVGDAAGANANLAARSGQPRDVR